jgi:hypothetical protein
MPALTALVTVVATGALSIARAPQARAVVAAAPTTTAWATNGDVRAIATTADFTYIGGAFSRVGPATGPWAGIDATTGAPATNLPRVSGGGAIVLASAPDGLGGFYLGGDFTHVGGAARQNIAHITSGGSVDTAFHPDANGQVQALAVSGSTVYAGGWFSSIGGASRSYVAALDASTGNATDWNPGANSDVNALAVSGTTVYAGGWFSSIGGQDRNNIAALDASTGLATSWDPYADGSVHALVVSGDGSTVYAGGSFYGIGGAGLANRHYIAAIDAATGLATAWNPDADYSVYSLAVSGDGSTVYAGGAFSSIGGHERSKIAALDAATGHATDWDPNPSGDSPVVDSLAVSGSTVYVGGEFSSIGGQDRTNLAAIDATAGTATDWNPVVTKTNEYNSGAVEALEVSGSMVYAAGSFGMIGGQTRNNIAAIDNSTGEPTAWNPAADGAVEALVLSGSTLYAGGRFTSIGGQGRNHLAALATSTGLATGWNPDADNASETGYVFALAMAGTTVYAGGTFTSIGGQSRTGVAALSAATGVATSFDAHAQYGAGVYAIAVSGSTVYVGGGFRWIGGQTSDDHPPRVGIAALDASTGLATSWNPNLNATCQSDSTYTYCNMVHAIAISGSTVYVGGEFVWMGGANRIHIAALNSSSGQATSWNPSADDTVFTLAVSASTVYAGGWFGSINGQSRGNLAAIPMSSGAPTAWNPNAYGWNERVMSLALGTDGTLYAGGSFSGFDLAPQAGFAAFPAPQRTLTVVRAGSGGGTVTSTDGLINCGATCERTYGDDTLVELSATPASGSRFTGWSGACTGTGVCRPAMTADRTVTATFNLIPPSNLTHPKITGTPSLGQTLTCTNGTWTPTPTAHTRVWKRNGVAISGATAITHKVVSADLQRKLTCVVTAKNGSVSSTPVASAAVTVKATTTLTARETTKAWALRSCGASGSACKDRKGVTVYFSGTSKPVPIPAAARAVTVRFYFRSSGVWRLKATVTVKASSITGTWRLAKTGVTGLRGAWRVRASVATTSTLTSSVTAYRYYTVV